MEADLQRYYGIDWSDTRPTFRRTHVLIKHLPNDSACKRIRNGHGWTDAEFLLADLFRAFAGDWHYLDPRKDALDALKVSRASSTLARSKARQRALGITGSVLHR